MKPLKQTLVLLFLLSAAGARAAVPVVSVSTTAAPEAFPLVAADTSAQLCIDPADAKVVQIAADLFAADVEHVTGRKPAISNTSGIAPTVIVGTLGSNSQIDKLAATRVLDVSAISGKWEAYEIAIVHDPDHPNTPTLVVAGADRRATAFGLLSLSQAIGVSPWYWWADVAPQKKSALYLSLPAPITDAPRVKYRGIFINDEDWGLNPWASKTFDPEFKNIGPKTYQKVFELLLRLRLNYLWPAMHACSTEFGSVPENAALANDYAIVAGASHCEPMLYNNVKWDEKQKGPWNYSTNRDAIHAAWEGSAKSRGADEAVWTLGIRGIHDAAMEAPRDINTRIKILTDVIHDERQLLDQYVTKKFGPSNSLPAQCFVPYKEVQPIYDAGLNVPDDVTLVWADDNFGYIRRLSNPDERKRSGGAGVYYHLSYYGQPHSYTWINTTPPALMWEELHKAWENDARTLWVLNVGDIKPGEIGVSYFAHLAWSPGTNGPDSQPHFLHDFAAKTFGEQSAQPIADLLTDFYRLGSIHKPELMDRAWAMSLSNSEADALEQSYRQLLAQSQSIFSTIPKDQQDAYTETIGFPARVLADTGLIFMADRKQQLAPSASESAEITRLRDDLQSQVDNFNDDSASGGKMEIHPCRSLVTGKDLGSPGGSQTFDGPKEGAKGTTPLRPAPTYRPSIGPGAMPLPQTAARPYKTPPGRRSKASATRPTLSPSSPLRSTLPGHLAIPRPPASNTTSRKNPTPQSPRLTPSSLSFPPSASIRA